MIKRTCCDIHEEISELLNSIDRKNPISEEKLDFLITLNNQLKENAISMEKRLRKYKTAIEKLGFKRI